MNWLIGKPLPAMETLNKRVYAQLFLTPASDPWLGMVDPDIYTGLTKGGLGLENAHQL